MMSLGVDKSLLIEANKTNLGKQDQHLLTINTHKNRNKRKDWSVSGPPHLRAGIGVFS